MSISVDDVRYVARLARLSFSPEEEIRMAEELTVILEYMQQLERVDTDGVLPMSHVLDRVDVFRPDEPAMRIEPQDALGLSPDADDRYFRVPKVIDQ